jgi:hypothetical protein
MLGKIIYLFLSINLVVNLALGSCIENPNILSENESASSQDSIKIRLPQILEHQNLVRSANDRAEIDSATLELSDTAGEIFLLSTDGTTGVSVMSKGTFSYISGFDDGRFFNYAYRFGDQDQLLEVIPLALHAISLTKCATIEVFRFMSKLEFDLWETKDLETLRSWPGLPGPISSRYWGYDKVVTHTTPFKPWTRVETDYSPCRKWIIPRSTLLEWASRKMINFGLTGPANSKEYEVILLESTWDVLVTYPSGTCF